MTVDERFRSRPALTGLRTPFLQMPRAEMPHLLIQLSKRSDGRAVMRCVRPDGSVTWQRHDGKNAAYFPLHDLTHWAVESILGFRQGFFGLIASGWEISDTTGKEARGPLPSEAILVEQLAGLLDRERVGGMVGASAEEFNEQVTRIRAASGLEEWRPLSDDELAAVRRERDSLQSCWIELEAGDTLELSFPCAPPPSDPQPS